MVTTLVYYFFVHGAMGAGRAPGIPCALGRASIYGTTRTPIVARERGGVSPLSSSPGRGESLGGDGSRGTTGGSRFDMCINIARSGLTGLAIAAITRFSQVGLIQNLEPWTSSVDVWI